MVNKAIKWFLMARVNNVTLFLRKPFKYSKNHFELPPFPSTNIRAIINV
jgi:hypothetical protein